VKELRRDDIVGKRIARILRSDWRSHDALTYCEGFVELEGGSALQFVWFGEDDSPTPVYHIDLTNAALVVADPEVLECKGEIIKEVVTNGWPTFGLLLESSRILVMGDIAPWTHGLLLLPVGSFSLNHLKSYWNRRPVDNEL
jgi:hypothetical protein